MLCVLLVWSISLQTSESLKPGAGEGCGVEEGGRAGCVGQRAEEILQVSTSLSFSTCQCGATVSAKAWSFPCGPHVTSNLTLCFQGMAY